MKTSHAILAITLGAAALTGSVFAESYNERAAAAVQSENWLAIPAIYDKVTAAGYSDISEIEREDDGYEVKARNAEGKRFKLYVDPRSGEVLDARAKGDKSKSDSFWWSGDKR